MSCQALRVGFQSQLCPVQICSTIHQCPPWSQVSHLAQDRATDKEAVPALFHFSILHLATPTAVTKPNEQPSLPQNTTELLILLRGTHTTQTQHQCDRFHSHLPYPSQTQLIKLHLPPRCCSREANRGWDAALGKAQLPSFPPPLPPHTAPPTSVTA